MYARNPDLFVGPPSHFCAWAIARFPKPLEGRRLLELGCGPGRDSYELAKAGAMVRAVDHSTLAIERARARRTGGRDPEFRVATAQEALDEEPPNSVDTVYAHALYMMFSEEELDRLLSAVHRVLRPGGLHAFAVRSTTDPRCGQGTEVAPDVWTGGPHEGALRYYRRESLARFLRPGFERLAQELRTEFQLWWVLDRRPTNEPSRA